MTDNIKNPRPPMIGKRNYDLEIQVVIATHTVKFILDPKRIDTYYTSLLFMN